MVVRRWPDGVVCPACGRKDARFLAHQRKWQCKSVHPKRQFTLRTGTVMEDSPIGLVKWLPAMWLLCNCKNGISSYELARDLGITQKSAWLMLHRIRAAMQSGSFFKLGLSGNPVEVDETFVGGESNNMHKSKRLAKGITAQGSKAGKVIVQGVLERGGKVKAMVVPDRKKKTLQANVNEHVTKGSEVFTDELLSYYGLNKEYVHAVINHAESYVRGRVHTNGMENFWSLLKRGLNGTYIAVEPYHIDRYLDEQVFRYNNRATKENPLNDADRFALAVSQIVGKRLTYAELTGTVGETAF